MKLDLDATNVVEAEITVDEARKMIDGELTEDLQTKIDEAQGMVFTKEKSTAYLVIKIS